MQLSKQAHQDFERHVLSAYPEEACGLLVDGVYVSMSNVHECPREAFRLDDLEYVRAASNGTVQAVLHSHPYDLTRPPKYPAQWPSKQDMRCWMQGSIPWGIVGTEGEGITQVTWLDDSDISPLVGREFVNGITDCYSIVRDYFRLERSVVLKNYARGMDWWETGEEDMYDANFEDAGFVTIPTDQATVGDVLLFQIRAAVTNHAAVITGPNEVTHHVYGHLSGRDTLSRWARHIKRVIRHTEA